MVVGLNPLRIRGRWMPALGSGVLAMLATAALAAGDAMLPDPTRPPDSMIGLSATGAPLVPAEPRLQSVMIGSGGRSAIIDGRQYKVGDKVGDARLVRISESEVVLSNSGGRQIMRLFPSVKQASKAQAAPRRVASRNP
jgi:MSHA biogenesis protein MshK